MNSPSHPHECTTCALLEACGLDATDDDIHQSLLLRGLLGCVEDAATAPTTHTLARAGVLGDLAALSRRLELHSEALRARGHDPRTDT